MPLRPLSKSPASPPPQAGPALGHTPSLKYLPLSKADRRTDERLREMIRYREENGVPHPDLARSPAGTREMTAEEATATRLFRERYFLTGREANRDGTRFEFERHEFYQTYRREGPDLVANQDGLVRGGFNFVPPQSGRFPAGTRVDIHSHPHLRHPDNAIPSDLDQRVAHQLRTNALHREGTRIDGAIMYYPPTDTFFGYNGELTGSQRSPVFYELVDNFPMPAHPGTPDLGRARMRVLQQPERRYLAYHPGLHGRLGMLPDRASHTPDVLPESGGRASGGPFLAAAQAGQRRALSADSRPREPGDSAPATLVMHHPRPRRPGERVSLPLGPDACDDERGRAGFGDLSPLRRSLPAAPDHGPMRPASEILGAPRPGERPGTAAPEDIRLPNPWSPKHQD